MDRAVVIAIDGPAASGKGTLARRIAHERGYAWLDTGLLYRAAGMIAADGGANPADPVAAAEAARTLAHRVAAQGTAAMDDPRLRGDQAADAASKLSAVPAARTALLELQREFARHPSFHGRPAPGVVLDGRDIGTVICPDADVKLFVTASAEERARRRVKELQGRGQEAIYASVLEDLKQRDARDSQRAVAPLKPAVDAFLLDTSALDADQALAAALSIIDDKLARVNSQS
ncbi:MAG TPA: (d)CMP kinase [Alphaproteobacteria bacterium]|nr:(d)CMP kinase [Alphaproteobacteria bacterium]